MTPCPGQGRADPSAVVDGGAVAADQVFLVDGRVRLCGVDVGAPEDLGGDVDGQSAGNRSVMNMRQKSCGVYRTGRPMASEGKAQAAAPAVSGQRPDGDEARWASGRVGGTAAPAVEQRFHGVECCVRLAVGQVR